MDAGRTPNSASRENPAWPRRFKIGLKTTFSRIAINPSVGSHSSIFFAIPSAQPIPI